MNLLRNITAKQMLLYVQKKRSSLGLIFDKCLYFLGQKR